MVNFSSFCGNLMSAKSIRWACGALAGAIVAVVMVPAASAQTANLGETWVTDCEDVACVTYFLTSGVQIFIGPELNGDRVLAEFRVLPDSIPGTPVSLRLDTGWIGGMFVNECNDTYCNFILDLTADSTLIDQFKAASTGMLAYVVGDDGAQIVMVPFHLDGFTAANNQRSGG